VRSSQTWLLTATVGPREEKGQPNMAADGNGRAERGKGAAKHGCNINRRERGKKG